MNHLAPFSKHQPTVRNWEGHVHWRQPMAQPQPHKQVAEQLVPPSGKRKIPPAAAQTSEIQWYVKQGKRTCMHTNMEEFWSFCFIAAACGLPRRWLFIPFFVFWHVMPQTQRYMARRVLQKRQKKKKTWLAIFHSLPSKVGH